jgi:[ribosomal protein S5]-alanine N-acetyltransferase
MKNHLFETERMIIRLLTMDDLDAVYRQFSDPDMCRYFSEPPCDRQEARAIIEHYQNPEGKDHLRYGLFDKQTGAFIGTLGYHCWDPERKQVEIGYDIWKEYWRQGYISDALPILIDLCFDFHEVECIYVLVHPENTASIASVRKFGFIPCEPLRSFEGDPQVCLKLMRADWISKLPY